MLRGAGFAAQGLRPAAGDAFVAIDLCDEAFEGARKSERVCAGASVVERMKQALRAVRPGSRGRPSDNEGSERGAGIFDAACGHLANPGLRGGMTRSGCRIKRIPHE